MAENAVKIVTCTAPVNIAVIKYWGKRDEKLILPINDSISVTLSGDQMHAKTSVAISPGFDQDQIWLNGQQESMDNPRLANCLREVRRRVRKRSGHDESEPIGSALWKVHICSENNFPTAAGLASSAAGYACLVYALCNVFGVECDVSELARQGSGSACRSVYGGFVRWHSGNKSDGSDSVAKVVQDAEHWPTMRILILVANDERKKVASSAGMKRSVETSQLLKYRADTIVPKRTQDMIMAIERRDFAQFAELTMRDSNQLHAVCLDTDPPCVYMNDTSHCVANLIHKINHVAGAVKVCYTFDAGPNACLFLEEDNVPLVSGLIEHYFPALNGQELFRGEPLMPQKPNETMLNQLNLQVQQPGQLKYIIATRIGQGPKVVATDLHDTQHLLNPQGLPVNQ